MFCYFRIFFIFILFCLVRFVFADFPGGSGTLDDPYQIKTPEQLSDMRNYLDKHFVLTNDIDLKGYLENSGSSGWDSIGERDSPFTGTLNGNDYTIHNIWSYHPNGALVGLFGYVYITHSSTDKMEPDFFVQDLGLTIQDGKAMEGNAWVAGLVGRLRVDIAETRLNTYNPVKNVFVKNSEVKGQSFVGAIAGRYTLVRPKKDAGRFFGSIIRSYTNSNIYYIDDPEALNVEAHGTIVGHSVDGSVKECFSTSYVYTSKNPSIHDYSRVIGLENTGSTDKNNYYLDKGIEATTSNAKGIEEGSIECSGEEAFATVGGILNEKVNLTFSQSGYKCIQEHFPVLTWEYERVLSPSLTPSLVLNSSLDDYLGASASIIINKSAVFDLQLSVGDVGYFQIETHYSNSTPVFDYIPFMLVSSTLNDGGLYALVNSKWFVKDNLTFIRNNRVVLNDQQYVLPDFSITLSNPTVSHAFNLQDFEDVVEFYGLKTKIKMSRFSQYLLPVSLIYFPNDSAMRALGLAVGDKTYFMHYAIRNFGKSNESRDLDVSYGPIKTNADSEDFGYLYHAGSSGSFYESGALRFKLGEVMTMDHKGYDANVYTVSQYDDPTVGYVFIEGNNSPFDLYFLKLGLKMDRVSDNIRKPEATIFFPDLETLNALGIGLEGYAYTHVKARWSNKQDRSDISGSKAVSISTDANPDFLYMVSGDGGVEYNFQDDLSFSLPNVIINDKYYPVENLRDTNTCDGTQYTYTVIRSDSVYKNMYFARVGLEMVFENNDYNRGRAVLSTFMTPSALEFLNLNAGSDSSASFKYMAHRNDSSIEREPSAPIASLSGTKIDIPKYYQYFSKVTDGSYSFGSPLSFSLGQVSFKHDDVLESTSSVDIANGSVLFGPRYDYVLFESP
ncbi:hypothetical protein [Endozoicomonas sp.]|uniref:hypothetical protein n=1 Tax=Endozoicomonas sp. TaxID=1892382 RepID=UPI00383B2C86